MTKYLIKLEPLDTFFFGNENKYRKKTKFEKEEDKDKTLLKADYFQRSTYFPQQTTLLGTLRYCLIKKNGQIPIKNTDLTKKLIGEKSFDVSEIKPDFGKIINMSPVFIMTDKQEFYFQNPKDMVLKDGEPKYLEKAETTFRSSLNDETIFFPNYNEKDGLSSFLLNSEDKILPFDYDKKTAKEGVFIEQEKIGITKGKDGKTRDNAYFKQIVYKLRKGFSFGFIAEIDDDLNGYKDIISMGAEKSPSRISFTEPADEPVENKIELRNYNGPKIVLLSDACLTEYSENDFLFAISETKTFRFLKTVVQTGYKYYSSDPLKKGGGGNKGMSRSSKYNLLERGSVFFFNDEDQMNKFSYKLKAETNFYQIGYNHHKIIKK
jgi:CRISPR-associated protein Cmr3